jgi:hypothetical protein
MEMGKILLIEIVYFSSKILIEITKKAHFLLLIYLLYFLLEGFPINDGPYFMDLAKNVKKIF